MNARRAAGGALLALAYFPARFIWDISLEHTRGLWSFVALCVLVGCSAGLLIVPPRIDP